MARIEEMTNAEIAHRLAYGRMMAIVLCFFFASHISLAFIMPHLGVLHGASHALLLRNSLELGVGVIVVAVQLIAAGMKAWHIILGRNDYHTRFALSVAYVVYASFIWWRALIALSIDNTTVFALYLSFGSLAVVAAGLTCSGLKVARNAG